MKVPKRPPNTWDFSTISPQKVALLLQEGKKAAEEGKYRHWDILRHLSPPEGLSSEEWWWGIKMQRVSASKELPLRDRGGKGFFVYQVPDKILEALHQMDVGLSKKKGLQRKKTSNMWSLAQEAIASSQIEGAATTRKVAKEMLRVGRSPRNRSEKMIWNNFHTMQQLSSWKDLPLSPALVFAMHRMITEGTLEHSDAAGRLRKEEEVVSIVDVYTGDVLHEPPDAKELPERLEEMCRFANGETPKQFLHPVVRAIFLHFWLAYEHPFVDGNGRTARTLFYWLLLRNGYDIFALLSISSSILHAPAQYGESFLYVETDQNDLTYFLLHQFSMVERSMRVLQEDISRKEQEREEVAGEGRFNPRQEAVLAHAVHNPQTKYTIEGHRQSHQVAYDTARQDLLELEQQGLLHRSKKGKAYIFTARLDLPQRL